MLPKSSKRLSTGDMEDYLAYITALPRWVFSEVKKREEDFWLRKIFYKISSLLSPPISCIERTLFASTRKHLQWASGVELSKGSGPRTKDIIYFYLNDVEAKLLRAELMQRYAQTQ